jgi:hypothetical protein
LNPLDAVFKSVPAGSSDCSFEESLLWLLRWSLMLFPPLLFVVCAFPPEFP